MLGSVTILLLVTAGLVIGAAALQGPPTGLILVSAALVLSAGACWRAGRTLAAQIDESRAWSEVESLKAALAHREALWSGFQVPAAIWDGKGQLVMATSAWYELGLRADAPPDTPEVIVGDRSRVFVVEASIAADGARRVFLREVSRERQALQAKDELLAIVGHEMRTPLSSIKGYGQLMARQLATVQDQVQRLDHLIADVLDAARSDAGRLNVRREPVSVRQVVASAAERFTAGSPERPLAVSINGDAIVEGDVDRLGQVLDNLLSNAAKYSPTGSTIRLESRVDGQAVFVDVIDQGRGISTEHLPRLFDRFYRVPVEGAVTPQGFGLGLSIVRDLAEAHGGRVEVSSKGLGAGSTFTLMLPLMLALDSEVSL